MMRIVQAFAAFLVLTLLVAPALAQTRPALAPTHEWSIAGFDSASDRPAPSGADAAIGATWRTSRAAEVRVAAQAVCRDDFPAELQACLDLVAARSFTSLSADGADQAEYFLVLRRNIVGGKLAYIRVTVVRK